MKFQRDYRLTIGVSDTENVEVRYPMTLNFDIARSTQSNLNTARLMILNMNESTRKNLFHDRFETTVFQPVVLQAGYVGQDPLPIIFSGNIRVAYSYRRRSDWITDIDAQDGLFAAMNSQVDQTVPAGASLKQLVYTLWSTMAGNHVVPGAFGDMEREGSRGVTLTGNSWELFTNMINNQGATAFIDQGKVHAIKKTEYIRGLDGILKITASTGLKSTQRRFKGRVDVEMVFEPRLSIGQVVELESEEKENNGFYQVAGVRHAGTISGAVDQGVVTSGMLWDGLGALTGVSQ